MKNVLAGIVLMVATMSAAVAAEGQASAINKALAANNIAIKAPTIQLTQDDANSASVFMEITNKGNHSETIIAANSMTADQTLLQRFFTDDDGNQAAKKVDKIIVKPHMGAILHPNGLHVQLIGLKQALHKGDSVPVVLIYSDGSSTTVRATVG